MMLPLVRSKNENLLYILFDKNAELLVDHAWERKPATIKTIKAHARVPTPPGSDKFCTVSL